MDFKEAIMIYLKALYQQLPQYTGSVRQDGRYIFWT